MTGSRSGLFAAACNPVAATAVHVGEYSGAGLAAGVAAGPAAAAAAAAPALAACTRDRGCNQQGIAPADPECPAFQPRLLVGEALTELGGH